MIRCVMSPTHQNETGSVNRTMVGSVLTAFIFRAQDMASKGCGAETVLLCQQKQSPHLRGHRVNGADGGWLGSCDNLALE